MPEQKIIALLSRLWILPTEIRGSVYERCDRASPALLSELTGFLETLHDFQETLSRNIISHDPSFPSRLQKQLHDFLGSLKSENDTQELADLERLSQELST